MVSVDFGLDIADPATYWPTAKKAVGAAIGTGTPAEQVIAALVIGFAAIVSSTVTLGATLLIALPALFILAPIGILRALSDTVNSILWFGSNAGGG